jgi:predicted Na+-dependent transporter
MRRGFIGLLLLVLSRRKSGSERRGAILIGSGRILLGAGFGLTAIERENADRRVLLPIFIASVCLMVAGQIVMRRARRREETASQSTAL